MDVQRTLRRPVSCVGIGLHSGNKVRLSLKPAAADFGIRFRRTDMMLTALAGLFIVCVALFGINNSVLPGPFGQWPLVIVLVIGLLLMSGFTPVALAYLSITHHCRRNIMGS